MIIAGLTGGIGHGKTTFANFLALQAKSSYHFETWELVAEVALALRAESPIHPTCHNLEAINEWLYALPDIISWHLHRAVDFGALRVTPERIAKHPEHYDKLFDYLQLMADSPKLLQSDITNETKDTFRPLLQWLGGYLVARIGGVWYDEIVRRIAHLRNSGYELVTVGGVRYPSDAEHVRNSGGVIITIDRPALPVQDRHDITERERGNINVDCVVMNDGNLEELASCAKQVYEDLCLRQLHNSYDAALSISKK